MRHRQQIAAIACIMLTAAPALETATAQDPDDWAALNRYRLANSTLAPPGADEQRVVFYGDSITEGWARLFAEQFPGKPYVGRGISGQTTPQMLVRFRQNVVDLRPAVVIILAGTNDIAGNTGPSTQGTIEDNLKSMVEIARANDITVVMSSVLPASDFPWKPGLDPGPKIALLNEWIRGYADGAGLVYLDYHSAMANENLGLDEELAYDGVHPTEAGYRQMAALASDAIATAIADR